MALGQAVAPHLPFLRRYARALTGDQQAGDGLVADMLKSLVADPTQITLDDRLAVQLYRLFQHSYDRSEPAVAAASGDRAPTAIADARLRPIPSRARQALLLTAVEGFTEDQAGVILGTDGDSVAGLVDEALGEIDRQTRARILIIEDEPMIAMDIEMIVRDLGHDPVAVAATHREAVAAAREHRPTLVLADIQLADNSSGIEAVQEILGSMTVPVIFVTAFPERLLTGERPEPAFLLTKPFQPATLRAAISQTLFFDPATVPA